MSVKRGSQNLGSFKRGKYYQMKANNRGQGELCATFVESRWFRSYDDFNP